MSGIPGRTLNIPQEHVRFFEKLVEKGDLRWEFASFCFLPSL